MIALAKDRTGHMKSNQLTIHELTAVHLTM
jgi:hypothetical protein